MTKALEVEKVKVVANAMEAVEKVKVVAKAMEVV